MAHELADILKKRVSALTITEGFDTSTDGPHPTISIGALTAGSQSMFIRIKPISWPSAQNSVGLVDSIYTPHVIQCVLETSTIANVALMTEANKNKILVEVFKRGAKVELYMSANTNAVEVSDITSGNLKAEIEADLYWNTLSSS